MTTGSGTLAFMTGFGEETATQQPVIVSSPGREIQDKTPDFHPSKAKRAL